MNPQQGAPVSAATHPSEPRPPSPPIGHSKRRCKTPKLYVESDSDSDASLTAGPRAACRGSSQSLASTSSDSDEGSSGRAPVKRPYWGAGRAFLDLEAESTSDSDADDATEPSGDECSVDWFLETRPRMSRKRRRVNLRLAASTDRQAEVVCPAFKRPRRQPSQEPSQETPTLPASPPQPHTRRSERLQRIRGKDEWDLDLRALRHNINQIFRGLRSTPISHGLANRLRRVVRDAYLMGYCRYRIAPDAWGHLLQVSGSRAFHLRNMVSKVEQRWEKVAVPMDLPPLAAPKYGPRCDEGQSDTSEGTTSAATDSDTPDDSSLDVERPGGNSRPQSEQSDSQGTDLDEDWMRAHECGQGEWDTPNPNSQPWLSVVLADTNSVGRSSEGSAKSAAAPHDSCRRMQFTEACPYPRA
ncbi:regulatory protein ICP22 [pteropodid alphaherpesvirus 2]|uniref:Regulatory protein ICP22 n=1 Tax=pteropodid alphaherpesvirus 2 TaxID=3118716 RepID=A0A510J9V9_9ALPH|nr:regulatory protein ICP22 [pteropodid alphaherpesvirus 2]BBM13233.1 regulatory protein ICP22 [pteropodid alphaherpesvirus 2]